MRLRALGSPGPDILLLSLTRDGRLLDSAILHAIQERLPEATDCFVFCHGWLTDQAEAREGAARFFAHVDGALRPLAEHVRPLRVAVHWPSKPFADPDAEGRGVRDEVWPEPLGGLGHLARSRPGLLTQLVGPLCEAEVPLSSEEELELDALLRQVRDGAARGGSSLASLHALSFWLMKRRAHQVGERLGREWLAPALGAAGDKAPRLHLIGHSFGAKLAASAVLGGVRPESLVLLLAAFSAFAFAEEVPTVGRPGLYRPVVAERRVAGPIVALRSDHDRAMGRLYPAMTWGSEVDRAEGTPRRRDRVREVVTRSAMGAVGARGVGAPEVELVTALTTGLPRGVVNVDASRVVTKAEWLVGAHRDIYHDEIGTLVLLAAGLLTGGPDGARPRALSAFGTA